MAFAEGPKASRRCALPPPPREAEGAVPARLRVAVTAADASADGRVGGRRKRKARTRVLTKELFLTLSRVPGAEHCSVACVDGATGAIVARVAARDAVFVTTANATETGTLPRRDRRRRRERRASGERRGGHLERLEFSNRFTRAPRARTPLGTDGRPGW